MNKRKADKMCYEVNLYRNVYGNGEWVTATLPVNHEHKWLRECEPDYDDDEPLDAEFDDNIARPGYIYIYATSYRYIKTRDRLQFAS